jgi:hypothetical protein
MKGDLTMLLETAIDHSEPALFVKTPQPENEANAQPLNAP